MVLNPNSGELNFHKIIEMLEHNSFQARRGKRKAP